MVLENPRFLSEIHSSKTSKMFYLQTLRFYFPGHLKVLSTPNGYRKPQGSIAIDGSIKPH